MEYCKRFDINTNELLVLDTSLYKTIVEVNHLDIVLKNRDENTYFRSPLKSKIKKIIIENSIKYHYKDAYLKNMQILNSTKNSLGVTELGRIIEWTKGQIQWITLEIPTIGYHTSRETTNVKSIDSIVKILSKLY